MSTTEKIRHLTIDMFSLTVRWEACSSGAVFVPHQLVFTPTRLDEIKSFGMLPARWEVVAVLAWWVAEHIHSGEWELTEENSRAILRVRSAIGRFHRRKDTRTWRFLDENPEALLEAFEAAFAAPFRRGEWLLVHGTPDETEFYRSPTLNTSRRENARVFKTMQAAMNAWELRATDWTVFPV